MVSEYTTTAGAETGYHYVCKLHKSEPDTFLFVFFILFALLFIWIKYNEGKEREARSKMYDEQRQASAAAQARQEHIVNMLERANPGMAKA